MTARCASIGSCARPTSFSCDLISGCLDAQAAGRAWKWTDNEPTPAADIDDGPATISDPAAYVTSALERECAEVAGCHEGGRNHRLNTAAFSVGRLIAGGLPLAEEAATERLTAAGEACGLPGDEIAKTIRSGLVGGARQPFAWVEGVVVAAAVPFEIPGVSAATPTTPVTGKRRLKVTKASSITVRPVRWLWDGRVALGTLSLIGGREGIGKSTVSYDLAGAVTRGVLRGVHFGRPRAVIVAATEDSWEHTIVPRLMAAKANLDLVYRIDVITSDDIVTGLSLPRDNEALAELVREVHAAVILLDPLLSRLDASLDTHKDAEVRIALEPLVKVAEDSGATVLGLIHVNKSTHTDPLSMLMGSRAFVAVARSVLFCMVDPDDSALRILALAKNNLGRMDLPPLGFRINSAVVATTAEGDVVTGALKWLGELDRNLDDLVDAAATGGVTADAADWLRGYLLDHAGQSVSADLKKAGMAEGFPMSTLQAARKRVGVEVIRKGFPSSTVWALRTTPEPAQSWGDLND